MTKESLRKYSTVVERCQTGQNKTNVAALARRISEICAGGLMMNWCGVEYASRMRRLAYR